MTPFIQYPRKFTFPVEHQLSFVRVLTADAKCTDEITATDKPKMMKTIKKVWAFMH